MRGDVWLIYKKKKNKLLTNDKGQNIDFYLKLSSPGIARWN